MRHFPFALSLFVLMGLAADQRSLFAADNDRAMNSEYNRILRNATNSNPSSTDSSSSTTTAAAAAKAASTSFTNYAATATRVNRDSTERMYENKVERAEQQRKLNKAKEEEAALKKSKTLPDTKGPKVESRVVANENAYFQLLAKRELERKMNAQKEKHEETAEAPKENLETKKKKEEFLPEERDDWESEKDEDALTDSDKKLLMPRLIALGYDPDQTEGLLFTYATKSELLHYIRLDQPGITQTEISNLLAGLGQSSTSLEAYDSTFDKKKKKSARLY